MNRPFSRPPARGAGLRGTRLPGLAQVAAAPAQDHVPALLVISDQRRRSRTRLAAPPVSEVLARQDDPARATDAMIESVETAAEYCDVVAFCEARNWHREALQWAQSAARLHPATHVARMRYCAAMNATAGMRKRWPSVANAWNITLAPCNTWRYFGPQNAKRDPALSGRVVRMGGTTRTGEHKHALEQHRHIKFSDPLATPRLDVSVRVQWLVAEKKLDDAWSLTQTPDTQCDAAVLEQLADAMPATARRRRTPASTDLRARDEMASSPMTGH